LETEEKKKRKKKLNPAATIPKSSTRKNIQRLKMKRKKKTSIHGGLLSQLVHHAGEDL